MGGVVGTPEDITSEASVSASTGFCYIQQIIKYGEIVSLTVQIGNTSQVSNGQNVFSGNITGIPTPTSGVINTVGYNGSCAVILQLMSGVMLVGRLTGGTSLSANSTITATITYLTSD